MGLFSKKKTDKKGGGGLFRRRSKEDSAVAGDAKKAAAAAAAETPAAFQAPAPPPAAVGSPSHTIPQSLPGEVHVNTSPSDGSHVSVMSQSTGFPPTPDRMRGGGGFGFSGPLLPTLEAEADAEEDISLLGSVGMVGRGAPVAAKADGRGGEDRKKKDGNYFTRSKHFKELCNFAFKTIDADGSGTVDKKELYTGLLMIHLKLATYAGPAACRPATKEYVDKIFDKMDADKSGGLDEDEFMDVMSIVCSQVFTRVILQWTMTLMIVPLIAQGIIKLLCMANDLAWDFWTGLDAAEPLRASFWEVTDPLWDKVVSLTPGMIKSGLGKIGGLWDKIPDGVKETLPVTLMSCVLGCLVVPYMLYKIDSFYEHRAEKKAKAKVKSSTSAKI